MSEPTNRTDFQMSETRVAVNQLSEDTYQGYLQFFTVLAVVLVIWTLTQVNSTVKLFRHIRSAPEVGSEATSGQSVMVSGRVPIDAEEASKVAAFQSERHGGIAFTLQWREPDFHRKNILWARVQWMCDSEVVSVDEMSRTFSLRTDKEVYTVDRNPSAVLPTVHHSFNYDILLGKYAQRGNSLKIDSFCADDVTVLGKLEIDPKSGAKRIVGDADRPLVWINGSKESLFFQLGIKLASQLFAVSMFLVILLTPRQKPFKQRFTFDRESYFIFDLIGGAEKMSLILILGWVGIGGVLSWLSFNDGFFGETLAAFTVAGFLVLLRAARNVEYFIVVSREEQCFYEVSRGFFWNEHKRIGRIQEVSIRTRLRPGADPEANNVYQIILGLPWAEPMVLSSGWWSSSSAETALLSWRAFQKELLADAAEAKNPDRQKALGSRKESPFAGSRDESRDGDDDSDDSEDTENTRLQR